MSHHNPMVKKEEEQLTRNLKGRVVTSPPVDIFENDDEFLITVDLPGVSSESLGLRVENGELVMEGTWSQPNGDGMEPVVREYRPTDYRRSFLLPDTVNAEAITADVHAGVLQVRLPKAEASKPRSIPVRSD